MNRPRISHILALGAAAVGLGRLERAARIVVDVAPRAAALVVPQEPTRSRPVKFRDTKSPFKIARRREKERAGRRMSAENRRRTRR